VARENIVVVSIMHCTAKKFEATRPEFSLAGVPDVDHVLTTQELARMIDGAGIRFTRLQPESLDLPLGFKTGAGVIFGNSGGVSEAVLRFAVEKLGGVKLQSADFPIVRGPEGIREATAHIGDAEVKIAIVHGLANARKIAEMARNGNCPYQLIEVMACPGGCIGGAGQPISEEFDARARRTESLYAVDKTLQLHKSQENPYVTRAYETTLEEPGSETAHHLLHTHYHSRKRIQDEDIALLPGAHAERVKVRVCVGTSCFVRGSQNLLRQILDHVEEHGLSQRVDIGATFCLERCDRGPSVAVGDKVIERCNLQMAVEALDDVLARAKA